MNEPLRDAVAKMPTPEQILARQVRLLRQGRGWSQQEFAEKMRAFGYKWSQATVTRLEAATRPIRVNELADLAIVFGVPVTQFLDSAVQGFAQDDLDALEREIEELAAQRAHTEADLKRHSAMAESAMQAQAAARADLAHIDGRLAVLAQWVPRFEEIAQGMHRKGDRRE
jgi:transcriptional regulator with XRE-family HTH domain